MILSSLLLLCSIQYVSSYDYTQETYDPLIEGYNEIRMKTAKYIQYHSINDIYKFNKMANIPVDNQSAAVRINLTAKANEMGAMCLDGSVPTIYFRPGYGDGKNKFQISWQGGGWCSNVGNLSWRYVPSMENCYYRSTTSLGTTKNDAPYWTFTDPWMVNNYSINPLSYNWNTIMVRYCDGSSFMSNRESPIVYNGIKLYFRGFRIMNAVLQYLTEQYGLDKASDVYITGGSAGGLTVWQAANYIRETYVAKNANYLVMPDSGYFLKWEGYGKYITGWKWNYENENIISTLNITQHECINKYKDDMSNCVFAQTIAPYVKYKLFAMQSRTDSWQLNHELGNTKNDTMVNGYAYNFTLSFMEQFINTNKPNHVGYLDTCYHHCLQWGTIIIDGYNQSEVVVQLYYGNMTHSNFFFQNDTYPCQSCCNQ
eukprot:113211_1